MMSTEFNGAKGYLNVIPLDDWFYYELRQYFRQNREMPGDYVKR
jgi:hypothetical protein